MKNIFYAEFWHKYYPVILCFILLVFHFLSAYPGGMSSDSFDQYQQSISGNYNSHHPSLMSIVWSLINHIHQGPQLMLLVDLAFLWGGILLLLYADQQNKYRYLYLVIALSPNILSQSATIWKDVVFALGTFFCIATCIFFTYRQKTAPLWVIVGLLLICFYIVGVKFQAKFIAPILILFILSVYLKTNILIRITATSIISVIIIYGNITLAKYFSTEGHSEQLPQFFDVAGVSVAINNDDLLPDYVKEDKNLYSFEKLKAQYTARWVDTLIFGDTRIYNSTSDPIKLQEMQSAYIKAIMYHPLIFLKHRMINFAFLMTKTRFYRYGFIDSTEAQKHNIDIKNNHLQKAITKYLKKYPWILTTNLISFILIFVYLTAILTNKQSDIVNSGEFGARNDGATPISNRRALSDDVPNFSSIDYNPEKVILTYIVAIGLVFSVVLLFATMASDYRYYYVIRVLTLFSLPIYLKFRHCKVTNFISV
ncbi:palindromic element RPE2 domain-containing protein [Candidatus Tisiphia endosymbiont of Nemotelus uliginosus]|uniref:palindromic element RPE2 domain-containing protein n=1 Tax=Candidatus Tisiphia endosymbiont of Nemotelus uliginosus TaxID=3077926 RepID=UPI0035C91D0C